MNEEPGDVNDVSFSDCMAGQDGGSRSIASTAYFDHPRLAFDERIQDLEEYRQTHHVNVKIRGQ